MFPCATPSAYSADMAVDRGQDLGLLVAGYVMAFVLPIGGLVTGFALSERRTGHALVIVMLSVFMGAAWFLLAVRMA